MQKPPKDAVAALGWMIDDKLDELITIEAEAKSGQLDADDDGGARLAKIELAALRWALKMAREMEGTT